MNSTSDPTEVLPPGIEQVYEGSSVTLNWSYNLSLGLRLGFLKFKNDDIFGIEADGTAVKTKFEKRFSVISTLGRVSWLISPVTVTDDGEFSCQLIDTNFETWKRAIHVKVIGKLVSVAAIRKANPN